MDLDDRVLSASGASLGVVAVKQRVRITHIPVSIKIQESLVPPSEVLGEFSFLLEGDQKDVSRFIEQLLYRRPVLRIRDGHIAFESIHVEKVSD